MDKTHIEWAEINIRRYEKCRDTLMRPHPPEDTPRLLMQCYRNLYGAEINFLDAGVKGVPFKSYGSLECHRLRINFAAIIEDVMFVGVFDPQSDISSAVMDALMSDYDPDQLDDC
jgi:hypothetical protein